MARAQIRIILRQCTKHRSCPPAESSCSTPISTTASSACWRWPPSTPTRSRQSSGVLVVRVRAQHLRALLRTDQGGHRAHVQPHLRASSSSPRTARGWPTSSSPAASSPVSPSRSSARRDFTYIDDVVRAASIGEFDRPCYSIYDLSMPFLTHRLQQSPFTAYGPWDGLLLRPQHYRRRAHHALGDFTYIDDVVKGCLDR
jgi:hypothetical protein